MAIKINGGNSTSAVGLSSGDDVSSDAAEVQAVAGVLCTAELIKAYQDSLPEEPTGGE